jgi:hypothetical protein
MPANEASPTLTLAFTALAAAVAAVASWGAARATAASAGTVARPFAPRLLVALGAAVVWMGAWIAVARTGALLDFARRPPPMLFMMVATLGAGLAIGLSPLGLRLARGLPLAALVGFQAFRLPLELVMDRAARAGVMPVQMSFEGWNFDIVTGASALIVAGLIVAGRAPRGLVVAWNVLGIVLLAAIGAIAVVSTPLVHAFGTAPAALNTWVGTAPFVWLPTVFVACALAGHVVLTRRLLLDRRSRV